SGRARGNVQFVDAQTSALDLVVPEGGGDRVLVVDDARAGLRDGPRRERLAQLVLGCQKAGVAVLLVIEDGGVPVVRRFLRPLSSGGAWMRLDPLDEARASDVMERMVLGGGVYFETGLSRRVAADLAQSSGRVLPLELQLTGAAMVVLRRTTASAF